MKAINLFLVPVMFLFCAFSCQSQEESEKEFILNFEKEILLNKDANLKSLKKYLELDKTVEKSQHFKAMIDYRKEVGKELNKNSDLEINVFSYSEVKSNSELNKSIEFKNLEYDKKENVYYVTYPSIEKNKIAHVVILNDKDKIISFYGYFRTGNDPVVPFMLNETPSTDIFGNPFM